jgi:hypothetical protein
MTTLIRLISGNDIELPSGITGTEAHRGRNRSELETNITKQIKEPRRVDVPSLKAGVDFVYGNTPSSNPVQVGMVFIDQAPYVETKSSLHFKNTVKEDGCYWKDIVLQYTKRHNITTLTSDVVFEADGNGMSDFEEVACRMDSALDAIASQVEGALVVQHTTGNPMLDMSLLMWGMKQRKLGREVSFLISSFNEGEQEFEFTIHAGAYWSSSMGF